jgi:endonuclease-3
MTRKERASVTVERLAAAYPSAGCQLAWDGVPHRLLFATILSAQTTDDSVNRVTPRLWEAYPSPADLAAAGPGDVERIIHSLGFFRSKTASLIGAAAFVTRRGGVPGTMDELLQCPGVGRKTANVVLGEVFGRPALIVDTHVRRLSLRLGFTMSSDPDRIERDLAVVVPSAERTSFSHRLGMHGRRVCSARKPSCPSCILLDFCPRKGL